MKAVMRLKKAKGVSYIPSRQIKESKELDYPHGGRWVWVACPDCGKERWVRLIKGTPRSSRCLHCATIKSNKTRTCENNPRWKGGRLEDRGYIEVKLKPDDFFYSMVGHQGYVLEHRLVMAKHLGRCLQPFEFIHHKNGIKNDNRIENLELTTVGSHIIEHNKGYKDGYRKGFGDGQNKQIVILKDKISELEKRIALYGLGKKE